MIDWHKNKGGVIFIFKNKVAGLLAVVLFVPMSVPVMVQGATTAEVKYNSNGSIKNKYVSMKIRGKSGGSNPNYYQVTKTNGSFVDGKTALANVLQVMQDNNTNKATVDRAVQVTYTYGTNTEGVVYRDILEKNGNTKNISEDFTKTVFKDTDGIPYEQTGLQFKARYSNDVEYASIIQAINEGAEDTGYATYWYQAPKTYDKTVSELLPDKTFGTGKQADSVFDMVTKDTGFVYVYDDTAGYSIEADSTDLDDLAKRLGIDTYLQKNEYRVDNNLMFYVKSNASGNTELARVIEYTIKQQKDDAPRKITVQYSWEYKGNTTTDLSSGLQESLTNTYPRLDDVSDYGKEFGYAEYGEEVYKAAAEVTSLLGTSQPQTFKDYEVALKKAEQSETKSGTATTAAVQQPISVTDSNYKTKDITATKRKAIVDESVSSTGSSKLQSATLDKLKKN